MWAMMPTFRVFFTVDSDLAAAAGTADAAGGKRLGTRHPTPRKSDRIGDPGGHRVKRDMLDLLFAWGLTALF